MRADLPRLSIGDAFDEAFDLYKRNFGLLLGIAALLYIPADAVLSGVLLALRADQFGEGVTRPTPADVERLFGLFGVLLITSMVFYAMVAALSGALTVAVSERYLDRPITIGQAYRVTVSAIPRLLGAWILVGVIIGVLGLILFLALSFLVGVVLAAAGATGTLDPAASAVIGFAFVIGFVLLSAAAFVWLGGFVTPAIVLERAGALGAIQRNIELVRGRLGALTVGFVALVIVILTIQIAIAGFVQLGLTNLLYPFLHPSVLTKRVVEAILAGMMGISGVVGLLAHPLWMTTLTILYYDQRVRLEGFDVALMIANLDERRSLAVTEASEAAG